MLNKEKTTLQILGDSTLFFIGLIVAGGLFLIDSFFLLNPLRSGISYLFSPVYVDGKEAGEEVKGYFSTLGEIDEFRKEYNELKIEVYEKDINNAHYQALLEENKSLKEQIGLGNLEKEFVLGKVLTIDNISNMQVDKGSKDGVKKGSVVSLGNMFVGIVQSVDSIGSLVLLPYSKNSTFEVFVTNVGVKDGKIVEGVPILSKGVVRGGGDDINIENISMNSDVKNGDVVITMDSSVSGYLVIGQIANLTENPATTSRSGKVVPIVNYEDLMSIYIEI